MKKAALIVFVSMFFLFQKVSTVFADGIIIPEPPPCEDGWCPWPEPEHPMRQLEIRYHHVDVEIINQIATVHVDQVFYNPNKYEIDGQYIFPIPKDASVDEFIMWMDNEPIKGKIMDADEARDIYEEIVYQLKDPALLEYVGQGAVQASIYPIPAGGEQRIELEYTQVLTVENGLLDFVYPLNTEKFSLKPLQDVEVNVEIQSEQALRAIYSPSHVINIHKKGSYQADISYQEEDVLPDQDFKILFSMGEDQAVHLLSYMDDTDESNADGYFMLLLAPPIETGEPAVEKDIVLIMDRSGSMEGEKFLQAQEAAKSILNRLNEDDRFYISVFSDRVMSFENRMRDVNQANDAISWIDHQSASGSTDINLALLDALSVVDDERPTYVIFLTDGLPTAGEVETDAILLNFAQEVPDNVRFFSFGVGYDVDTNLLDSLSQENHGSSTYVKPDMQIDEILSGFYEKISSPVLTDLDLDFGNMTEYDMYPSPLPDLFAGNQVIVTGRYKQGGKINLTLSGEVNGKREEMMYRGLRFSQGDDGETTQFDMLPRIWATRKIGYLLREIRLNGMNEELIEQVIQISVRYGIVTPYTSYLVEEPHVLGVENQQNLADEAMKNYELMPSASAFGAEAVDRAAEEGALSDAQSAPQTWIEEHETVKIAGNRTFLWQDDQWVDTLYDAEAMKLKSISFLSNEYYKLMQDYPEIQKSLALGSHMIIVIDGKAYQILDSGKEVSVIPYSENESRFSSSTTKLKNMVTRSTCFPGIAILGVLILFFSLR
ncbi:MAG: VWA domain-containing protein [Anaerolineaceae bacterium]|nr:VWA domain-containing protein [Anaerolineaceae bacterium]